MLRQHGRYGYSALPQRPVYDWPGDKRLAVYIAVNIEQFPYGEGMGIDLVARQPEPDIPNFSLRDYGNRVGVWNMLNAFDEYGLPTAALINSEIYDHAPEIAAAFRARGDEIVGHGRTNAERQGSMPEEEERALIAQATARLTAEEGNAPRGWMGPWVSESHVTPDLLTQAGYAYVMDWPCDDQPIWLKTQGGRILAVPYSRPCNDLPLIHGARATPEEFAAVCIDQFDEMLRLSADAPLVFNLSLHPFLMGWPFRLKHLRRVLAHIAAHRDAVWLTRPGEIYDHVAGLPDGVVV